MESNRQNAIFRQISTTHNINPMRTTEIQGWYYVAPEIGSVFSFYAPGLTIIDSTRRVHTSIVQEIHSEHPGHYEIRTLNSIYEILDHCTNI